MKDSPYKDIFSYAVATWVVMLLICAPIYLLITYESLELNIPVHANEKNDYSKTDIIKTLERCKITIKGDKPIEKKKACSKAAKELNNYIKDKRNLNAQEGIWRVSTELLKLTTYHLIAIIVSIFASIVGLYFIVKTFNQVNTSNDIARESLHVSNRPICDLYLSEAAERKTISGSLDMLEFNFEIINLGKTPAVQVFQHFFIAPSVEASVASGESMADMTPYYIRLQSKYRISSNSSESSIRNLILPTRLSEDQFKVVEASDNKASIHFRSAREADSILREQPILEGFANSTALVPANANDFALISMTHFKSTLEDKCFSLLKTYKVDRADGAIYTLSERRSLTYMDIQ